MHVALLCILSLGLTSIRGYTRGGGEAFSALQISAVFTGLELRHNAMYIFSSVHSQNQSTFPFQSGEAVLSFQRRDSF